MKGICVPIPYYYIMTKYLSMVCCHGNIADLIVMKFVMDTVNNWRLKIGYYLL